MQFARHMLDYFDIRYAEISDSFAPAAQTFDHEAIHDLRVAIKRVKACFILANCIDPGFKVKKHFLRFRKLFKSCAELRDIQIQLGLAKEIPESSGFPVDEYIIFLQNREMKAQDRFGRVVRKFSLKKLLKKRKKVRKALVTAGEDTARLAARERLNRLVGEMKDMADGAVLKDETMHRLRSLAKSAHYTREIVDRGSESGDVRSDFIVRIKRVHQALGKWHDYDVALGYLEKFGAEREQGTLPGMPKALAAIRRKKSVQRANFRKVWPVWTAIAYIEEE
jgi:CHAD domain-containing protein